MISLIYHEWIERGESLEKYISLVEYKNPIGDMPVFLIDKADKAPVLR